MLYKLGFGYPDGDWPFEHPDVFERQQASGTPRLRIGPRTRHIDLLLSLARTWMSPYAILYVLLVPRGSHREPGRYQSPVPLEFEEVHEFCTRFEAFLEADGRHHLWIASMNGETLVYDRHQWIYAYGDLDAYEAILTKRGLCPGTLDLPVPHSHHYHDAYDEDENAVMAYWPWLHSPLRDEDDPP